VCVVDYGRILLETPRLFGGNRSSLEEMLKFLKHVEYPICLKLKFLMFG
jgi:hypothetical protein